MPATDTSASRPERPAPRTTPFGGDDPIAALTAIGVVADALTAPGSLQHLAATALGRMREALDLEIVAMHLVEGSGEQRSAKRAEVLIEFATDETDGAPVRVRRELSFDVSAWSLLSATRGPVVVGAAVNWLIPNPFDPPPTSWLVLPLQSEGAIVGTVVAASAHAIALDAASVVLLSALGNVLSVGIATARLRTELQRLAVQRERMRLAADLHDGLAQDLAVAKREIARMEGAPAAASGEASWWRLREAIDGAHRVVRAGLEDLSVIVPIGGLFPAVEELSRRFAERGLTVSVQLDDCGEEIAPDVASTVLRVLGEALANVEQHSTARRAQVALHARDGNLRLEVSDPGSGMPRRVPGRHDGHFGIAIMCERARAVGGAVDVAARSGGGTIVTLHVPLAPRSQALA